MVDGRKVALITGAAGGIGQATVALFCQQGWDVVGVDQRAMTDPMSLAIQADVSSEEDVRQIMAQIDSRFGRIDALVNNAAEQVYKPLIETMLTEWDRVMASNVRSVYLLTAHAHPFLQAVQGCIVNVASVHAVATSPGLAAYVASKGAVVALTRAMALEFSDDGIRVNAVLPGAVDTPMLAAGLTRAKGSAAPPPGGSPLQVLSERHPLGRVGQPHEIAHAIHFLADAERAGFITGQTIIVDGGATAKLSTE